ncbi:MAG TPA: winged helix-turn-helix domain-containing protein [Bryobacterales bacterium]|nr:winged helix-turn-helix domain-containing protein [Bryobacterales bacterium]
MRFGPFELDLRAGELRKEGRRIRLQEQPFQILRMLLQSPGDVVLREEIRNQLWPPDIVVEFEHSINAAVKRLRAALRDSADKPRYIETMARRGYRFICPVEAPDGKPAEAADRRPASAPASAILTPSIAVLPFADMSGDKENEYFSDGLAEEIINKLTRVPGLKVIARTSAFAFKGKHEDIRKIAEVLGVASVLEGSVRRSGSRVRVVAQLITAVDGSHLWSERYDREMADIFAIQDEIAQAIASALQIQLSAISSPYTPRLPAYEAYLKARHCMAAFTRESLLRSRDFCERAIALDAGFAPAHSGLAASFVLSVLPGLSPARTSLPLARAAAQKALDLEPASPEAHAVLGMVAALYEIDWVEAKRCFRLAVAREPVPPYVRWHYGFAYLVPMGRTRECIEQCMRGLQDDPLNFVGGFTYAGGLLAGGSEEAGEAELRELSELHPNLYQPFYLLALSLALRGLHAEALAAAENAYSRAAWHTGATGLFAGALARAGKKRCAEELLQKLLPGDQYGTPLGLLLYHLMCSEMDRAADWAAKVFEERDPRLIFVIALLRTPSRNILLSNRKWSALAGALHVPLEV